MVWISHHCWFTKVCLIVWVAKASNSRLHPNLWTRTGSSTWETGAFHQRPQESKKSVFLEIWREMDKVSEFWCITDLIWFLMKEAEKLTKGSMHEENFFIVHDALVLMTSKGTTTWWVAKASNSRLHPNLWTRTGSSTRETSAFHQRPQESKKIVFLEIWRYTVR